MPPYNVYLSRSIATSVKHDIYDITIQQGRKKAETVENGGRRRGLLPDADIGLVRLLSTESVDERITLSHLRACGSLETAATKSAPLPPEVYLPRLTLVMAGHYLLRKITEVTLYNSLIAVP